MTRVIGTASNMGELSRLLSKRRPVQPEAVRLIRKYYPNLGQHSSPATLPTLAAEWYSDLAVLGVARVNHHTTTPYERASNRVEFLACLATLLTEAEKHSHLSGYGYRQHFAAKDLTPTIEAKLEASGNAALRAVRDWHTEVSLPPVERFVHRARKIELWQNEQHQLTTLGLDSNDWRDVYNPLFLEFRRAIYHTESNLLRAAYTELNLLLPSLDARWLPRLDEFTGEESNPNSYFFASQFVDYWLYCEFVPLRPTSATSSQRDPCLFGWLSCHINIKQWFVWRAVVLLAGILDKPVPPTPISFQERIPKPATLSKNPEPMAFQADEPAPAPQPLDTLAAPATAEPVQPLLIVAAHPWVEIEALAVQIGLRNAGGFTPASNRVGSAVAGLIDALREAEILPTTSTLPTLYADFSQHYSRPVGIDRVTPTRAEWQRKARKALGLD